MNLDGSTFKKDGKKVDFFLKPVWGDDGKEKHRNLLFATKLQLKILANCGRWYMDGTCKLVAFPFKQLWSIHGFIKGPDGNMKQEAFFHSLMTRRKKCDFKATFAYLLERLDAPNVFEFVSDFLKALWLAVESSYKQ